MNNLTRQAKKFWKKNGATTLTVLGGVGVVATAVMAVKATPKALELIDSAREEKGDELTKWEIVQTAAPVYLPSVLIGTGTLTCIFGANVLNKKTQSQITAAYAMVDQSFKQYKKKVSELYGQDSQTQIQEQLALEQYDEQKDDIDEDEELPLFYDQFSKRYFNASEETVLRAEYEINKMVSVNGGACLNDFYELVGLPIVDYGDFLGWSAAQMFEMYWDGWLHFHHTRVDMEGGMECWIIDYTELFNEYDEY